jgi:hypothetical protein
MSARATVHAVGSVAGLAGGYALVVSGGSATAQAVFAGTFQIAVVLPVTGPEASSETGSAMEVLPPIGSPQWTGVRG